MYAVALVVVLVQNDFCGDVMMRRPETYICKYNRMSELIAGQTAIMACILLALSSSMMEILSCIM